MNPNPENRKRPSILELASGALLLALAGWLLFAGLGDAAFHDGDEALYAAVAVHMADTGDWMTPYYWGAPLLNKPPLPYWLMATAYELLPGPIEFSARLPSALCALVLAVLVYLLTRSLVGPAAAAGATLLMLFNMHFLFEHGARSACFDAPVVMFGFAALVAGARAHVSRAAAIVSAVCLAAVVMIKGPVVIFAFASILAYLLLLNRRVVLPWLGWCLAAFVVIAAPWHVYQLVKHGGEFWNIYVVYEMLGRSGATESLFVSDRFIHLSAAWRSFLPWSPVLAAALVAAVAGWPGDASNKAQRLLAGYALLILIGLCFVRSKWPWYVFPAYPALAVLAAVFVRRLLDTRWRWTAVAAVALTAAVWFLLFERDPSYNPVVRGGHLWPLREGTFVRLDGLPSPLAWIAGLAAIFAGGVAMLPRFRSRRRLAAGVTGAVALVIFAGSFVSVAQVPTRYESAPQKLGAKLRDGGVQAVFLIGFMHQPRYGYRIEPLSGFYLTQSGAQLFDCKDLTCIDPPEGKRSALVADLRAMTPRLEQVLKERLKEAGDIQGWLINPESSSGYREF